MSFERARLLLPLAFAIAVGDDASSKRVAPSLTWSTTLLPFGPGMGYFAPPMQPRVWPEVNVVDAIASIEEWAALIDSRHHERVDIAARRLVSALAFRKDPADRLVDAVMVWENILGAGGETSFRLTTALAKLLEPDPARRRQLRNELKGIYGTRSGVAHGSSTKAPDVARAATEAVEIAVLVLRDAYRRGAEWLQRTSSERSDALLLDEVQ